MLRSKSIQKQSDRFITGRSKERDNNVSKFLISDQVQNDAPSKKKLVWNEARKMKNIYLSFLEDQLFVSDENNGVLDTPITSRKKRKSENFEGKTFCKFFVNS